MNASQPAGNSRRWKRLFAWMGFLVAGSLAVLGAAAIYTFTLDHDARLLRRSIVGSLGAQTESTIEIHIGESLVSAARLGVRWCNDIPEPARVALAALRSASVGVYHIVRPSPEQRAGVLIRAQAAMEKNGWTRIVGVNNSDATVLVYAPTQMRASATQHFCVAVINGDRLVIASANGNIEKLQGLLPLQEALHRL